MRYQGVGGPRPGRLCGGTGSFNTTTFNSSRDGAAETRGRRKWAELVSVRRPSGTRDPTPGHCTKCHGRTGEPELVKCDEPVWAVGLRSASGAKDGARNPDLRVPGQLRGRGKCLDARLRAGLVERCNQTLDEWMIGRGLSGREIDIMQFPREASRIAWIPRTLRSIRHIPRALAKVAVNVPDMQTPRTGPGRRGMGGPVCGPGRRSGGKGNRSTM